MVVEITNSLDEHPFFRDYPRIILPVEGSERYQRLQLKLKEYQERKQRSMAKLVHNPRYTAPEMQNLAPDHFSVQIMEDIFGQGQLNTREYYEAQVAKMKENGIYSDFRHNQFWGSLVVIAQYVKNGYVELPDGTKKELPQLE